MKTALDREIPFSDWTGDLVVPWLEVHVCVVRGHVSVGVSVLVYSIHVSVVVGV